MTSTKVTSKKKNPIAKLIEKSDAVADDAERELSFYMNDRVKLMKEVLKIINAKKIKSMAPRCMQDLDVEEINSMLLEELLGISNKRLKYIFNGQNPPEDSSSTDSEEDQQPVDVISLDDISDDDFVIVESDVSKKVKTEHKSKKIKKEKCSRKSDNEEENLMSVLELLELQARARAIRSQLMLEANKKQEAKNINADYKSDQDDDDAIIIEIPKNEEIVIDSTDSESEHSQKDAKKKIVLIRDRTETRQETEAVVDNTKESNKAENKQPQPEKENDEDEIILIVDQEEMDGMIE